ncbi:MAG: flagellar hook-length control protein FliK [Sterolibacterium sp.]
MPEITATPILPLALTPAKPGQGAAGKIAQNEDAKLSKTAQTTDAPTPNNEAGTTQSNSTDSFASILQRQLAQVSVHPVPVAKQTLDVNLDPAAQTLPIPADALGLDPAAQTLSKLEGEAALLAKSSPAANLKPESVPNTVDLASKPDDDTHKDAPDNTLASQSPYLFGLVNQPAAKLDTTLPREEKDPPAESDNPIQLAAASPLLTHAPASDAKNILPANVAGTTQTTANKPAEFAATPSAATDAAPAHPTHESAAAETGFDNLLAAAQAFQQNRTAGVHTSSHASPALPVKTPVGAHGWDGEVSDKLVWMVGRQEQRAELVLNPPQLGRVEVSLSTNAGQTNALFVSANPAVRDALEAALPRLREMLADAGVTLGQAQVGADTGNNGAANQSANHRENWDNSGRTSNTLDLANGLDSLRPVAPTQWLKQGNGLVDVFA